MLANVRRMGKPDLWYGPGCCTAFSCDLLPVLAPFPGNVVPYDNWITVIADALGVRRVCERPLQMYRRHASNASSSVFARPRAGRIDLVRTARAGGATAAIVGKVAEIDEIIGRLNECRSLAVEIAGESGLAAALAALAQERDAYATRAALLQRDLLGRAAGAMRMLAGGGYARFSGLRTALKDIASG